MVWPWQDPAAGRRGDSDGAAESHVLVPNVLASVENQHKRTPPYPRRSERPDLQVLDPREHLDEPGRPR